MTSDSDLAPTRASKWEKPASELARSAAIVFSDRSVPTDLTVSKVELERLLRFLGAGLQLGVVLLRLLDALFGKGADLVGGLGSVERRKFNVGEGIVLDYLGCLGHFPILG